MLYIWENTVNNKCFKNRGSSLFHSFIPCATIPTHYHVVCFRCIANQAQPNVWFYPSVPRVQCYLIILCHIHIVCMSCHLATFVEITSIDFHSYADDQQNYCAFSSKVPDSKDLCLGQLESCPSDVRTWMQTNLFKLNDSKTEFLLLGSQHQLSSVGTLKIKIGKDCIKSVSCARNLGFWMDSDLKNKTHINKLMSTSHQSLKGIAKIRQLVDKETCQTMIQVLVTSRVNYCNSLLLRSTEALIDKLQKVQNMACCIMVCKCK